MKSYIDSFFKAVFSLTLVLVFTASAVQAQTVAKMQDVVSLKVGLKEMLQNEGAKNLKKLTVAVDEAKAAEIKKKYKAEVSGNFTVFQGLNADGNVIGTVVQISEDGKEGPLQLLVAFRENGEVYDIGFTLFGEDKGKSASTWNYLKQFIGKTPSDDLMLGKDIDGISGATWTSESVSNAVKRATAVYGEFFL